MLLISGVGQYIVCKCVLRLKISCVEAIWCQQCIFHDLLISRGIKTCLRFYAKSSTKRQNFKKVKALFQCINHRYFTNFQLFCTFLYLLSWFYHWKRIFLWIKLSIRVQTKRKLFLAKFSINFFVFSSFVQLFTPKMWKKYISTSDWSVHHPNVGHPLRAKQVGR